MMADRAVVFIDGNNWFHSLRHIGVQRRVLLNYRKITEKLIGPRQWVATKYYIGQISQKENPSLYAQQRSFLAGLERTDPRISICLGRIEPRTATNEAAVELRDYLQGLSTKIDPVVFAALSDIAARHAEASVYVEKAVDVFLAIDLVAMAMKDVFDAAYLLTADGDFTPAVAEVRSLGKKVYAASPLNGAQLAKAVNSFIHLRADWFEDCYEKPSE
jgi:uncharacterized LabA/DUF88 family protein